MAIFPNSAGHMPPRVTLPRSGLVVPRIGVGLAHLHLLSPSRRARLVDAALDLGLTHFDTAPFYGDGVSERTLGTVLGARRGDVTIATKFGLLPTRMIGRMGPAAPFGRKVRSVLKRLGIVQYPRRMYTPTLLRASLTASLRALRTDHVDVLSIHEPAGAAGIDDALIEALLRVKEEGLARFVGVAGDTIGPVLDRWGDVLDVVQTAENRWADDARVPDFTYSLFSSGRGRKDPPLDQDEVDQRLVRALARRAQGAVLLQTSAPERLARYVELAAR